MGYFQETFRQTNIKSKPMSHYTYYSFRDPIFGGDILFGIGGLIMNFAVCRCIAKMRMFDHFTKYYLLSICISYIGIILMGLYNELY